MKLLLKEFDNYFKQRLKTPETKILIIKTLQISKIATVIRHLTNAIKIYK